MFFNTTAICLPANLQYSKVVGRNYQPIETVANFTDVVPSSVAVSEDGRIFLCCPDGHSSNRKTLIEVKNGCAVPYPDAQTNKADLHNPTTCLLSAMAAVVDDHNHLWVLDSGRANGTLIYGGAKLVDVDLSTNKIFKVILLKNYALSPDIVLYALKIDPSHGNAGMALIIAASSAVQGAILVSDLETGHTMRRLYQHNTLYPNENFLHKAKNGIMQIDKISDTQKDSLFRSFGLAISGDRDKLYYSAVACRNIYSVDLDKLCDPHASDKEIENTIKYVDYKVALGTSIECDKLNKIYLSDIEHNAIWRRQPDGTMDLVLRNDILCNPDHLLIAKDGYLYATTSRFCRELIPQFGEAGRTANFAVVRMYLNNDYTDSTTATAHQF